MDLVTIFMNLLAGLVGGAVLGYLFYMEKNKNDGVEFSWDKIAPTIILSGIIGAALGLQGIPVTMTNLVPLLTEYGFVGIGIQKILEYLGWLPT